MTGFVKKNHNKARGTRLTAHQGKSFHTGLKMAGILLSLVLTAVPGFSVLAEQGNVLLIEEIEDVSVSGSNAAGGGSGENNLSERG
ncbi:MAG: hypothetical protein PHE06_15195, partial [Lachnospiraceae bacterium]|nr:hypothetical protein [Lachnospiraceae bacterium]